MALPPGVLLLEVTEGSLISNVRSASDLVKRLRELCIPLLLDDFGTGYSSLSYLQRFQFDYLKIDRSFVSRITTHGGNAGIVRAIIRLATDLGMKTVAEGVETYEMAQQLRALGCEYGQGYYFSRPLDPDAATALLQSRQQWQEKGLIAQLSEA
jgi:EAL domain-containing protein (putative c-di-GMP-specific phosphodiesterase class I)